MPPRSSLHSIIIVGFLCAIFVAILWQGAPGYQLRATVCPSYVQADGADPVAQQQQALCCKNNPGDLNCKGFQTGGDAGAAAPAPAPAAGSASSCNVFCFWGTPDCSQSPPCPCGYDSNGNQIYHCTQTSVGISSVANVSSSSTQGNTGPAPAAAPAPAPAPAPPGFVTSSSSAASSSSSSVDGRNTGPAAPAPAPVPPPPPPSSCTPELRSCALSCPADSMSPYWGFSISGTQNGQQCTAEECGRAAGHFIVALENEIGFSCMLSQAINPPVCPSQTTHSEWILTIGEPRTGPNGELYTATLQLGDLPTMYYHYGQWDCAGPNTFDRLLIPGVACSPIDDQIVVSPVSSCDISSSSSSSSIPASSSIASSESSVSSIAKSSQASSQALVSSSSSSVSTNTPCDSLICALGGNTDCQARGFTTCSPDLLNAPYCHSCSGVPRFSSSSSSSTGFRTFSSSSRSSSASVQPPAASSSTSAQTSSTPPVAFASSSSAPLAPVPVCGDSLINRSAESCDDGPNNGDPSSRCASSCLLNNGQSCTLNAQCDSNRCIQGRCLASCTSDSDCPDPLRCVKGLCKLPECGDGVVSPGETCDLGKTCTSAADSCNRAPGTAGTVCLCDPNDKSCPRKPGVTWARGCVPPPGDCGNGILDTNTEVLLNGRAVNRSLHREECDLGVQNGKPDSPCSSSCTLVLAPFCGNNRIDPGERCDDGALNGTAASNCPSDCGVNAPNPSAAGSDFTVPTLTARHPAPTPPSSFDLPLLPVRVPGTSSANLARLAVSHPPVAKTGPEALLAIAMGAGFGWSAMRRRKQ